MTAATEMSVRIPPKALSACIGNLTPMPQATLDALRALRDESLPTERCAELIGHDPALAARALRLANSAFYGVPGRVNTLPDAVQMLGRRTLYTLLAVALLATRTASRLEPPLSAAGFWRHALAAGFVAREIATALRMDAELGFVAGLLHDIGRITLAEHFPAQSGAALQRAHDEDLGLNDIEQELLGTNHLDVGAMVALHWRLPTGVAQAIATHHAPTAAADGRASLADVVHLADAMAHALDLDADPHERVPPLDTGAWDRIGLPSRVLLQAMRAAETGVAGLTQALGIAPDTPTA